MRKIGIIFVLLIMTHASFFVRADDCAQPVKEVKAKKQRQRKKKKPRNTSKGYNDAAVTNTSSYGTDTGYGTMYDKRSLPAYW